MKKITAVVLAAGKGVRMKSALPKVLHPVCSRPMLLYVLDLVKELKAGDQVVVLGYGSGQVKEYCSGAKTVVQKKQLGTADAVKRAMPVISGSSDTVLVLYGDAPLLKAETLKKLIRRHREYKAAATVLTAVMADPSGYGRILRDSYSAVCGIREDKDADDFQKTIKEINTGIICFDKKKLRECLALVRADNRKKEYYLTDVLGILYKRGELVESVETGQAKEALGINSRVELAEANSVMRARINETHMRNGVSIIDPATTVISFGVKIGADTSIYPFTVIEKDVKIGKHCSVGPLCRLRPGTSLADNVSVGNFIEVSRSSLKAGARAKHFGFLGDARIGEGANIGAGTVTANYDGKNKNVTTIGRGAFIGCDSVLVAPVTIGKQARSGAGAVVTRGTRIPAKATFVGVPAKALRK